jgi:O-antigen/teichoic acid export membrane protein
LPSQVWALVPARFRDNPIARRLMSGTAANLLGKGWALTVQLVSIPILTHAWGADGYGIWLMLITIPFYIGLSDFGMGTAAGVEITRRIALADHGGALDAFQSVWAPLTAIATVIAVVALGCGGVVFFTASDMAGPFTGQQLAAAIIAMTLYACGVVQMSILNIVYRATHKYAFGTFLIDLLIPVEGIALLATAWFGGSIAEAAIAMLAARVLGWFAYSAVLHRHEPWARIGWRHASAPTIRALLHPSLAAFSLTLSNAIAIQGMILVLGWAAGPATVAVFGAARTLTRIPLQLANLVPRASIPELTRSQVAGNVNLTRRLLRINIASVLLLTLPFMVILIAIGPALLHLMSGARLIASPLLFALLAVAAALNVFWQAAASPLVAMNLQTRFAHWYLIASIAAVAVPLFPFPDRSIAASAAMMLSEAALTAIVLGLLRGVGASAEPARPAASSGSQG